MILNPKKLTSEHYLHPVQKLFGLINGERFDIHTVFKINTFLVDKRQFRTSPVSLGTDKLKTSFVRFGNTGSEQRITSDRLIYLTKAVNFKYYLQRKQFCIKKVLTDMKVKKS